MIGIVKAWHLPFRIRERRHSGTKGAFRETSLRELHCHPKKRTDCNTTWRLRLCFGHELC